MKKPKLDEPSASEPSGRNELYQSVIDLDKSSGDASTLIDSVFDLLGLSFEGIGAPKPVSSISDQLGTPKHQWALRWCLKKLSGDATISSNLRKDPRIWRLISHLLSILPSNGSNTLLMNHNFGEIVKETLSSLKSNISVDSSSLGLRKSKVKCLSKFLEIEDLFFSEKSGTQSKKRKRYADQPESSQASGFLVFQELIKILQILQVAPESDVVFHFGKPLRLQTVFRLDVQETAQILGDGLSQFESLLQACLSSSESLPSIDVDLLTPLFILWQNASGGVPAHEVEGNCLPFLENALEPCLRVFDAMKKFADNTGLRQNLSFQVKRALATSFVLPFRSAVMDARKASKELVTEAKERLGEIEARLTASGLAISDFNENETHFLPPLFELAFTCCQRSTVTRKSQEDHWLETLMFILCNLIDIQLRPSEKSTGMKKLHLQQKRALSFFLDSAARHQLQIPRQSLQSVLLRVTDVDSEDEMTEEAEHVTIDWDIVNSIIKINPTSILSSNSDEKSVVISKLFRKFSMLRSNLPVMDGSHENESLYDYAFEKFVPPLVDAFTKSRSLQSFIKIWTEQLQAQLETDADISPFPMPWTDERLLSLVSDNIANHFSPTHQFKHNAKLLGDLQSSGSGADFAATLVVAGCFVSALKGAEINPELLKSSQQLFALLAETLSTSKAERKCPKSQAWRMWRIVTDIGHIVDDTDILCPNPMLEELTKTAEALISKSIKGKSTKAHNSYEGAFAFRFIETLSRCRGSLAQQAQDQLGQALKSASKRLRKLDGNENSTRVNFSASKFSINHAHGVLQTIVATMALQSLAGAPGKILSSTEIVQQLFYSTLQEKKATPTALMFKIEYRDLWSLLLGNASLQEQSEVLRSLKTVVTEGLVKSDRSDLDTSDFILETLSHFEPFLGISVERKKIAENLQDWKDKLRGVSDQSRILAKCNALTQAVNQPLSKGDLTKSTLDLELSSPASSNTFNVSDISDGVQEPRELNKPGVEPLIASFASHLESKLQDGSPFTKLEATSLVKLKSNRAEQTEETKLALGKLCCTLLFCLRNTADVLQYSLLAKSINHLLSHCSWSIAQFHIDTLLSIVEFHTSSRSKSLSRDAPEAVFKQLCKLFGSVLSSHRAKIGGRYHLVVPALQGLLRCLFQNRPNSVLASRRLEHPFWLSEARKSLSADCATDFSRLVTSLSDPTVSAARSGKSNQNQELNDPTKKARSLAGQSLQFVVMEFCSCQLRGHIEQTVREKLIPGIYSILDAMTKDVMQNMNAAMDSSQRAIFKTLYDDWSRFGKWNGG